jgi:LPXTG-motif cell wall-anchored protein
MKKLAIAIAATAMIALGHGAANAQDVEPEPIVPVPENSLVECGESDGREDQNGDGIEDDCTDFYVEVLPPTTPPPPAATTTTTTTVPPRSQGPLPRTGSGISPLLGIGAALFVGGGIVVVATRRRQADATT